ncbi:MAG TPA: S8 family serine peptidase [Pyrinomonadaceae bacterium]|nr:S8 family serine peptidase [Pyrinomonadaceae bacterium]
MQVKRFDPDVENVPGLSKNSSSIYIVRMLEDPVVAYKGDIPGLRATKPARGQKINPYSPEVTNYVNYLDARHDAALNRVGGGRKLYDYRYSFNGFTAELTQAQAAKLAAIPGVASVELDEAQFVDTSTTPAFLGLDQANGLWNQLGGVGRAGEDIIIGIVDTGIWPEHPSFSDRTRIGPNGQEGKLGYQQIPGWHGKCTPGEEFNASHCNQKLIGAQYFYAGSGLERINPADFLSARDFNSHGSHTASTAGGNNGVQATGIAAALGRMSGIAPRARIAAYKVCWDDGNPNTGDCFTSDSVAAIDQAVADGVDVINFSISGTTTNFLSPVEVAFLFAADAGVFVATSAGNTGPGLSTVAHPSPWVTTVAASTHNRGGNGSVTLGNGAVYAGASLTPGVGPAPLVYASDVGVAGADPNLLRQCFSGGLLDPAKVAGKIVLCERGGAAPLNARVDKSFAVQEAGGVGTVIANITANTLNPDLHVIPTVHVDHLAYPAIRAYIAANGASASAIISQGIVNTSVAAPLIAAFSSRGPSLATGDQLKPDVSAPGVDVLAAVSPVGDQGRLFDLFSGTSMASPHVAGLGALLKNLHPSWSPMMIKSALMTTGYDLLGFAATPAGALSRAWAQGAGHVQPNAAANPGLVYDSGFNDWVKFLCGTGQLTGCAPSNIVDPSDLNLASIAIGDLAGVQTVRRTVKNVGGSAATYTATVSGLPGINVVVSPSSFTIPAGGTQTYTVTFTRTTAAFNAYQSGFLTWSDGTHNVRSPVVIRPFAISAPSELSGTGTSGSMIWNITTGYNGALTLEKRGLIPATTFTDTIQDDPTNNFNTASPAANQGIKSYTVTIPAGTTYARFALFDNFTDGADDLDLYVYNSANALVGASGGPTSAEVVNLVNPAAGTYTVYVHAWQTDGPDANYTLFTWVLGSTDAGNMTISGPAAAVIGVTSPVNLSWSGLSGGTKYLGSIAYREGAAVRGTTIIRIDTP